MLLPPNGSADELQRLRAALGLDQPLLQQFLIWLKNLLHGNAGLSIRSGEEVSTLILSALPVTLQLVTLAILIGAGAGFISGVLAFRYRFTPVRNSLEVTNAMALSVPEFLWGILLMLVFGIGLRVSPFFGEVDPRLMVEQQTGFLLIDTLLSGNPAAFLNVLSHYLLPSLALALAIAPTLMRILYSSLNQIYASEYMRSARLRGLPERRLLLVHALRNAVLPALNLMSVQAGMLIGGTLLIEKIYGLQGIGSLMIDAINNQDLPVIQAVALVYAICVLMINQATEWLQHVLDPRAGV